MSVIERDIETLLDTIISNLGWIDDINSPNRTIYKQQAKTAEQNKALGRKAPDYVFYQDKSTQPLIVLEVKRPGKDLVAALRQGEDYANIIKAPIVIVTDGVFFRTKYMPNGLPLKYNGEEVKELITQERALEFINQKTNEINTLSIRTIKSRAEMIKVFEESNDLLRTEGIEAGLPRFSEFVNILFLKLISELAEIGEKPHNIIPTEYRWNYFKSMKGNLLLNYVNDTVMDYYQKKYDEESLFEPLNISNPITLEEIIKKLDTLKLVDINEDIKGEAFEHFLKSYATGENDLGQYFTPRHIVKFMVNILNPHFGETIYDPFCGTGGMLIESYKHIKRGIKEDEKILDVLQNQTIYGSEITRTARITKMNMILMGDGHSNIVKEDSLKDPKGSKFDIVITNQPFAQKTEHGNSYPIPSNLGNSICIQKSVLSLEKGGRAALIVQEGVLFDKKYLKVREWLFKNIKVRYVISLPQGVFLPYTNAKTSIIFLEDKENPTIDNDEVFFVEIRNDGYTLNNYRDEIEGESDLDKFIEIKSDLNNMDKKELFENNIVKVRYEEIKNNSFNLIGKRYKAKQDIVSKYNLVKLASLCTLVKRGPFGSAVKKSLYVDEGIKVYTQKNVIEDNYHIGDYYITEEYFNESLSEFEIEKNDVLMTCAGTLGKLSLVPEEYEKGIINSVLTIFRPDTDKVLPYYLLILMRSEYLQSEITDAVGTGIKNLRPISEIKELLVPLPTLEEQEQIVLKYRKMEKEIENRISEIEILKDELSNLGL